MPLCIVSNHCRLIALQRDSVHKHRDCELIRARSGTEMKFWMDMVGWAASAAVLATFCMNTMIPLRMLAIISNVLFFAYGAIADIFPVMILHAILLPVNVVRLVQIRKLVHGMQVAENAELSIQSLLPFMSRRRLKAGDVLVRKGTRRMQCFILCKAR